MAKTPNFSQKIIDLQKQINAQSKNATKKEKCIPTMLIAGIIAPILIWVLLYFLRPSFVQKRDGNKYIRCGTKVFYWTVLITVAIWVTMYLVTFCSGYKSTAMLCARK